MLPLTRSLAFRRFATTGALVDGTWTSPWVEPGFEIFEVIPSWTADTPAGSVVEIWLQARTPLGLETGWYALGRWAYDDDPFRRTSVPGQDDEFALVDTDTLRASAGLVAYRLRVVHGRVEDAEAPTVRTIAAIASSRGSAVVPMSAPGVAAGLELSVPSYAQTIHADEYPEYAGGGASWCSPASTAMVIAFWGTGPTADDLAWVDPALPDPWVAYAARHTYDLAYDGTGNWPFNTAYAACFGLDAFVTRLESLALAELFVRAGIPLVLAIAAGPGELEGFLLPQGTNGHLVVVRGFTSEGDPIVNDPAAESNAAVRRVYDRGQFERAWLGGSGGIAYVIRGPGIELPSSPGTW